MQDTEKDMTSGHLESCPLKGARAAELACGDHHVTLADSLNLSCLDMLESLPVVLSVEAG